MNRTVLFVLGVVTIIAVLFIGITPFTGQRDDVTAQTRPPLPGEAPQRVPPTGPAAAAIPPARPATAAK